MLFLKSVKKVNFTYLFVECVDVPGPSRRRCSGRWQAIARTPDFSARHVPLPKWILREEIQFRGEGVEERNRREMLEEAKDRIALLTSKVQKFEKPSKHVPSGSNVTIYKPVKLPPSKGCWWSMIGAKTLEIYQKMRARPNLLFSKIDVFKRRNEKWVRAKFSESLFCWLLLGILSGA